MGEHSQRVSYRPLVSEREAGRMKGMAQAFALAAQMMEKGWTPDQLRQMAFLCTPAQS